MNLAAHYATTYVKRMNDAAGRTSRHFSVAALSRTLSLRNELLFAVALLLSVAPLWFGKHLPMVDMPQHAAQIAALREFWAGNPLFTQLFQINWFTPYLLGYVLLYGLSLVMPVAIATQVLVSAALVSIPLLTGAMLREAGADDRWKWLAIPCTYSFAFYWGFLSFLVAAPFALLFLIATIRYARAPRRRNALLIAAFSLFLFFCHVIVLGFASLVALGYVAGANYRDPKTLVLRTLPYATPVPLIAVWMMLTYQNEERVQSDPIVYGSVIDRAYALLVQPAGGDAFSPLLVVLVTGAIAVLPALCGSRWSRRPERWLPLALGVLVFVVSPHYVFSTAYFYQRLGVFLVPLWLLAWNPPSGESRRLDWLAMLMIVAWGFVNTARFAAFARETESFDKVVEAIEPGRKVASMVFDNRSPLFAFPVYLHFPAWYQAERRGVVDFNFADFFSQMARYRKDAPQRVTEILGWYPTEFQWKANGGAHYDYFIVKAPLDISNEIFKEKRSSVEFVGRSGWWWLYRNLERAGTAPYETAPRPSTSVNAEE